VGTPADVYHKPSNLFVARFIGSPGTNLVHGNLTEGVVHLPGDNRYRVPRAWLPILAEFLSHDEVILGFRPEGASANPDGELAGSVYATEMHGAFTMLAIEMNGGDIVQMRAGRDIEYPIGSPVRFDLDPEMVRFFDPKTEGALRRRDLQ
jgi:ABC-type sugar transport system ATPase subunit